MLRPVAFLKESELVWHSEECRLIYKFKFEAICGSNNNNWLEPKRFGFCEILGTLWKMHLNPPEVYFVFMTEAETIILHFFNYATAHM